MKVSLLCYVIKLFLYLLINCQLKKKQQQQQKKIDAKLIKGIKQEFYSAFNKSMISTHMDFVPVLLGKPLPLFLPTLYMFVCLY